MCCLFGLVDYGHTLSGLQKSHFLSVLAQACEERGTDATGIAYNTYGRLRIYKRPLPAHSLRFRIPEQAAVVMGHTRMTTQGSEKKNYNNHPFRGVAGGLPFALAHNGVLRNDVTLRRSQRLPRTEIETDSFIAVQLIEQKKALTFDSLKYMAEQVEGSFTFTVLDSKDRLYFVKGDNPLYLCRFPRLGIYLYASTQTILAQAVKRLRLEREQAVPVELDCGDILRIDPQGRQSMGGFDPSGLFQQWFWRPCSYAASARKDDGAQQEYLDELKSIAAYYGYAPELIDGMLKDGASTDEIEELLYCGEL